MTIPIPTAALSIGVGFGGESRDNTAETISNALASSACTVETTAGYIQSGTRTLKFPLNTAGAKAIVPITVAGLICVTGYIGVTGQPTSAMGLLSNGNRNGAGGAQYIEVGNASDLLLRVYDGGGTLICTSLTPVPIGSLIHFAVVYDYIIDGSGDADNSLVKIYVNGVEEVAQWYTGGVTMPPQGSAFGGANWGEWLEAGIARGADLYGDDLMCIGGNELTPEIYPYPIMHLVGGAANPATAEGDLSEWNSSTAGPNSFQDVDEFPDNAASFITTTTAGQRHQFTYSAANPVTSGALVAVVNQRLVHAITSGSKLGINALMRRDAASLEESAGYVGVSTAMAGDAVRSNGVPRPGGGQWVRADLDVSGVSDLQFGVLAGGADQGSQVSLLVVEVYEYTDFLQPTTMPKSSFAACAGGVGIF